jgi:hypothetical protein
MIEDEYVMRRKAVEFNIPVFTNLQLVKELAKAISAKSNREKDGKRHQTILRPLNSYMESGPFKLW